MFGYTAFQLFDENQTIKLPKDMVVTALYRPKLERDVYNWIEKTIEKGNKNSIPIKFGFTVKKLSDAT